MSSEFPINFLIDRKTADTVVSPPFLLLGSNHRDCTLTFTSEGTTSTGNIIVEESDLPSYTGTWSQLHSQAASGFTGNAKLAVHIQIGAGMWVRARINTTIGGGGTATVTITNV